jgi:alpha/beta superfamily hydrolase
LLADIISPIIKYRPRLEVITFFQGELQVEVKETRIVCNGVELHGELRIPQNVPAPAIIICHGMNSEGCHELKIYRMLAEAACKAGFVCFLFDFRGMGKSGGRFDYGFAEQDDFKCALDFFSSRSEVLRNCIYVVGHSLGGAVSLYALRNEKRVKGLVLWAVPKNHDYNVRKFIRRTRGRMRLFTFLFLSSIDRIVNVSGIFKLEVYGITLRLKEVRKKLMKLNETEAISRLEGLPVLVVVGSSDKIVGQDEAQAVYESAPGQKSLLIIESANHTFSGKEEELVSRTLEWIEKLP